MKIGIISYLNENKDEAYINCISEEDFNGKFNFKPSFVPFEISLNKLLCIQTNPILTFFEFIPELHSKYLDLFKVKTTSGINLLNNKKIVDFLIENDIADKYNSKIIELNAIKNLLDLDPFGHNSKVKIGDFKNMVSKYAIRYVEEGRDKPGDWSRAWITLYTSRPSNLPNSKLDKYLENLFPKYDVTIADGDDDMEHRFKSDILRKLRDELGEDEIKRIKQLCEDMTRNVQEMALLAYRPNDHANFLARYYREFKLEIINSYK